jgi:protease-4
MKTFWKVLLTFGILTLFIFVISALLVFLTSGFGGSPSLGGGYVAVIPIKGDITSGGCGGGLLSGPVACASMNEIKASLNEANNDWSVDAILLDIDSGGGSSVASQELAVAVKDSKKPVVAYIGESGASGAYYIASAARKIVANRNSITGSIGVRMQVEQYYGLMEKLGVNVTVIKAGDDKDAGSPYRPMTDAEQEEFQHLVDKVYDEFVSSVAENRNLSVDYVRSVANGKIYLGSEAKELKLIDELGSFEYAVNVSAMEAGIEGEPKVKMMTQGDSIGGLLSGSLSNEVLYKIVKYLG